MSGVTRYDKLDVDGIKYNKPENTGSVYFGSISYNSSQLLLQSSRLIVKEIKKNDMCPICFVDFAKNSPSEFLNKLFSILSNGMSVVSLVL